jgi:hypothetical protein
MIWARIVAMWNNYYWPLTNRQFRDQGVEDTWSKMIEKRF